MLRLLEESGQLPAVVNVSGAAGKKKQSVPSKQTGKRGEAVRKYNRERENNGLSPITFMGDEEFKKLRISFDQRARLEIAEIIGKERRGRVEELIQTDEYKKMPSDDQLEALTLGQRIVVMNQGQVQQVGTPTEIYEQPVNQFVAGSYHVRIQPTREELCGERLPLCDARITDRGSETS